MSDREALVEEVGLEVEEEEKEQFASNGDHTPLLEFAGEKPQEKATKRVFSAGKIRRHKYTLVKLVFSSESFPVSTLTFGMLVIKIG